MTHTHSHHGILGARNTQTQVILGTRDDVVRNLFVVRATIKTVGRDLWRNTAKLLRGMSLQLGLSDEGILRKAWQAIWEGKEGCRDKIVGMGVDAKGEVVLHVRREGGGAHS